MIRIGTRGSALARWQAERVRAKLAAAGLQAEVVIIKSSGDLSQDQPVAALGVGIFTKELEDALLAKKIDAAVHSLKDLPSQPAVGLALAAVPEREDVRDAVLGSPLASLPAGARVASSSPRRQEWVKRAYPGLVPVPVRGNVDTRVRKLDEGQFEALVMALAGLKRLGLDGRVAEVIPLEALVAPAGQGAIAVETRAGEDGLVAAIDDAGLHRAVDCERMLFQVLRAGCRTPLGAYAVATPLGLKLVADLAGLRAEAEGADGHEVAERVAKKLLEMGGAKWIGIA
ncbi:MAG: hydroxymethylbilane synthase [Planctomycetes bacterium]|nr:hydroxymethylbilane synthase [Planctomycetota bacterium]